MPPGGEDEASAGTIHRLQRVLALVLGPLPLRGRREEHVLLVVVPVARAVPELDVEHLRGLDLLVAAGIELLAAPRLDQAQQDRPVREPEGHTRRLGTELEEIVLRPQLAVVTRLRLLDPL